MKAMLFAAGYGTRLRPLTDAVPKPALPFFGRPLIAHALEWLAAAGVDTVVVNLHHLGHRVREAAEAHTPRGMAVVFSDEAEILGTGGGLRAARAHFAGEREVLVVNGDVFTRLDLGAALRVHRQHRPAATLVLNAAPAIRDLFGVGLDASQRIVDFWGDPPGTASFRRAAFTGVHVTDPALLDRLPERGYACIKDDAWLPLLREGGHLQAAVLEGPWFDIGTPERYLAAHLAMAHDAVRLSGLPEVAPGVASAGPLPAELTVVAPAVVGRDLRVEGPATIGPNAFIGAHVTIAEGARVREVVVVDGARVAGTASGLVSPES